MMVSILSSMFERDLKALHTEISAYTDEVNMWKVTDGISNSGGNLCLHLIGNLKWFVGAQMGGSDYIRQRELEFSARNVSRESMLAEIDETRQIVVQVLENLPEAELEKRFPIDVFKKEMTTGFFLTHLVTHLAYHKGQINYHRRLLDM